MNSFTFDPAFTHLFFSYISDCNIPFENRLQAAIYLKNIIASNWSPDENDPAAQEKAIGLDTQKYVKDNLSKLLLMNPRKIGENLVEIANVVGKIQLQTEWPNFLPVNKPIQLMK